MAKVATCGQIVHKNQAKDSKICIHCGTAPIKWDEMMGCHVSGAYNSPKKQKVKVIQNDVSYNWGNYWKPVYSAPNSSDDSFIQEYF